MAPATQSDRKEEAQDEMVELPPFGRTEWPEL